MSDKPFLDTNVIIYALSSDDPRNRKAEALLDSGGVISVQVLTEFVNVCRRKLGRSWDEVDEALGALKVLLDPPQPLTAELHDTAVRIARDHGFSIFDSLIIAAALHAGCPILYSEDLQHGQVIEGLTVRNPFAG